MSSSPRSPLLVVALCALGLALAGCPASPLECQGDADCADQLDSTGASMRCHDAEGAGDDVLRLCLPGCRPGEGNCEAAKVCVVDEGDATGRCRFADDIDPDPDEDAGPVDGGAPDAGSVDAGPVDAGPVDAGADAGVDAGPCGPDEVLCGADCVTAGDVGGGLVPLALEHCGLCGRDLTERATECLPDAGALCGNAPLCAGSSADGGAPLCVPWTGGAPACVQCTDDGDCGGGSFCCAGSCRPAAERDEWCGCAAGLDGGALAEPCTQRATERTCTDVGGTWACGCAASGDGPCGTTGGLERLCDVAAGGGHGACVDQGPAQCGVLDGVVPREADAGVADAVCTLALGGEACLARNGEPLGACGCVGAGDCDELVFDGGIPHRPASSCSGGGCVCAGAGDVCAGQTLDCVGGNGCYDFQNSELNCGSVNINCGNTGYGVDENSVCVNGGCQCDDDSQCQKATADPPAVNDCIAGRCVCNTFSIQGSVAACPLGLECIVGGCEYPAGSSTGYPTLGDLLDRIADAGP